MASTESETPAPAQEAPAQGTNEAKLSMLSQPGYTHPFLRPRFCGHIFGT